MFAPTTSIFSSSFFSFSFSFSFFLAFAVMDSTAVETWICQERRRSAQLQHRTLRFSSPGKGQREIRVRSVLTAGVNKINSTSYPLLCLRDNYRTIKANKKHRWDRKNATNAEWVQPHMQKESRILNLEINHYCLGLYMRGSFIFNKAKNGNLIPRVSKVKKHVYRYTLEWPKAVPVSESDSCVSHWSKEVHLQNGPWSSPQEALALLS